MASKPIIPGNLSEDIREKVQNSDGSVSTVRTISIGTDKGEVVIPTVIGGKVVDNEEAIAHYKRTGENFGTFGNVSEANDYAEQLHLRHQQQLTNTNLNTSTPQGWNKVDPNDVFAEEEETLDPFADDSDEAHPQSLPVDASQRPLAKQILALARSPSDSSPVLAMGEEALKASEELLAMQQDYNERIKMSLNRNMEIIIYLDRLKEEHQKAYAENSKEGLEVTNLINQSRQLVLTKEAEENAHIVAELEALERIENSLAEGDYTEAYIHRNLLVKGGPQDIIRNQLLNEMVISQRYETLAAQYEDSGWLRGFVNGVLRLLPKDNFDVNGLLADANIPHDGSLVDFFLRGENYANQRESFFESVRGLPPEEFARVLSENGDLMKSIKDNAGFIFDDPTMQLEIYSKLIQGQSKGERYTENFFGVLDTASMIPVFTGMKLAKAAGARRLATEQLAKAIEEGDAVSAAAKTGETVESITDELLPTAATGKGGVPLHQDALQAIETYRRLSKEMPDIASTTRFTTQEELIAAIDSKVKDIKAETGKALKDFDVLQQNTRTGEMSKFEGELLADGQAAWHVKVTAGKPDGTGGYASAAGAKKYVASEYGLDEDAVTVIYKDEQWYGQFTKSVPTEGFITGELKSSTNPLFVFWRSNGSIGDRAAHRKALIAENAANNFAVEAKALIQKTRGSLHKEDRVVLDEIIKHDKQEAAWHSVEELAIDFKKMSGGREITDDVIRAYSAHRQLSDYTYGARNHAEYTEKVNSGFESMKLYYGDEVWDVDGKIDYAPTKAPLAPVFDISAGRIVDRNWLTTNKIKDLKEQGYVIVRMDQTKVIASGEHISHVLVKRGDLETRPLRYTQVNYSAGGSRAYADHNFAKQANADVNGNLVQPSTWIAGKNVNEMKKWVSTMNEAIAHMRDNPYDPNMVLLEGILSKVPGAPTPTEFVELIAKGKISTKYDIEVVGDKKFPSQYYNSPNDALRYVDMNETSIQSYHRSSGQLYYSPKGEHLKNYEGKFAETIDPWQSLNDSLTEVTRLISYSGFKKNLLERFKNNWIGFLDIKDIENVNLYSLVDAKIKTGIANKEVITQIQNQQEAIRRVLNFQTGWEKSYEDTMARLADWALGDTLEGGSLLREKGHDALYYLSKNNPAMFVRKLAFHSSLGFWNPGQLAIQASTSISALALYGSIKPVLVTTPLVIFRHGKYREDVLDVLAKKPGVWKGFFKDGEEFKSFMRTYRDSGVDEVSGHTFSQIGDYGPDKVFGASSVSNAVTENGLLFFWMAERHNRATAAGIAWDILRKDGRLKPGQALFNEEFIRLTDKYSLSMMNASKAGFQRGFASIPTQFWAYSFRMLEALVGKQFTKAQKARLLVANTLMGGAAGFPLGGVLEYAYEQFNEGPAQIGQFDGFLSRGLLDTLVYAATDGESDIRIGEKFGTMDVIPNLVRDVFNLGEYGDKSIAEAIAGASGSKIGSAIPVLYAALEYTALATAGIETGGMAKEKWISFAKELQTLNFIDNARIAYQFHYFKSKKGTVLAADLPSTDAFFFALGFQPGQGGKVLGYRLDELNDDEMKEYAKTVNNWRQEAMVNEDKLKENAEKENALMGLLPIHDRLRVRRYLRRSEDRSLSESVERRWREEQNNEEWEEAVERAINSRRNEEDLNAQ